MPLMDFSAPFCYVFEWKMSAIHMEMIREHQTEILHFSWLRKRKKGIKNSSPFWLSLSRNHSKEHFLWGFSWKLENFAWIKWNWVTMFMISNNKKNFSWNDFLCHLYLPCNKRLCQLFVQLFRFNATNETYCDAGLLVLFAIEVNMWHLNF